MSERPKISAVVQTYNAERHLDECLEALKVFDEILVVDMESTDRTLEIARAHGARVIVKERAGHTIVEAYRDFAIHAAAHPWVLVVDADEIIPRALADYLYEAIAADPSPRAFLIPIKNYFMGRWMRSYYPEYIKRCFPREGTTWPYIIHSRPTVAGPDVRVPAYPADLAIIHLANEDVSTLIAKMNNYTDREVTRRRPGVLSARFLYDPAFRFFKRYILKGGFRDGMPGFIHALHEANYRFYVLAKMAEKKNPDSSK